MNFDVALLIPISLFICVVVIIKIVTDNRTRQKLINQGLINENIKFLFGKSYEENIPTSLKWGLVLIGIGAAIMLGQIVPYRISDEITISAMFLFAGIGLLVYYFLASRILKKRKEEELVNRLSDDAEGQI